MANSPVNDSPRSRKAQDYRALLNIEIFRNLHRNVLNVASSHLVSSSDTVDALKQVAELLIWGDVNNSEGIFEYFCEENLMEYMTGVLSKSTSRAVRIQLVQTISMLIYNIQNKRTLYYLLSNNYINGLISVPEMYSGGDVSSWTVSLLKTLSGLLDATTIKFFFLEKKDAFPLLDQSAKFLSSSDGMKRAHVMTIILNILKVRDASVTRYIIKRSKILTQLPLFLRQCWCRLNRYVKRGSLHTMGKAEESILVECDDALCFLQEIMDLEIKKINKVLLVRLFNICFIPLMKRILKTSDIEISLLKTLKPPTRFDANYFRDIYQDLCTEMGLTSIYAHNKTEIFSGGVALDSPSRDSAAKEPVTSKSIDDGQFTPRSESSTPRETPQLSLHSSSLLPNVAYFLLTISLRSARRIELHRPLLLLLLCPTAPKGLLMEIHDNESISVPGTPKERLLTADSLHQLDDPGFYDRLVEWEKKVFEGVDVSSRSENGAQSMEDISPVCFYDDKDHVCNIIMGEFIYEALSALPISDSRLIMLLTLLAKLQDDYIKNTRKLQDLSSHVTSMSCTYPEEEIQGDDIADIDYNNTFMEAKDDKHKHSATTGLQDLEVSGNDTSVMEEDLDDESPSMYTPLDSMELEESRYVEHADSLVMHNLELSVDDMQVSFDAQLSLESPKDPPEVETDYSDFSEPSDPLADHELKSFVLLPSDDNGLQLYLQIWNAISRHLTSVTLRVPVVRLAVTVTIDYINFLSTLEPQHVFGLKMFIDELRFHLDASLDVLRVHVLNSLESNNMSQLSIFFDEWVRFSKTSYVTNFLHFVQAIYEATLFTDTVVTTSQEDGKKESLASWIFRESRISAKRAASLFIRSNGMQQVETPRSTSNSSWKITDSPENIYRRHVQVALLIRELYQHLNRINSLPMSESSPSSTPNGSTKENSVYYSCPLFHNNWDVLHTETGIPLALGVELPLEKFQVFPCTMTNSGDKVRLLYSHMCFLEGTFICNS
ncbi:hypothetical protein BEWA_025010 [Theileria equi strain WA]|uniref:FPL domain-containing protein n=1 Tax=Theileria equi strain WA TaxID=1537102 RepID=L0AVL5_THEEQ|nr:hypothetical protein BEWA_025010 [Theileria equi strain WA]AFZ79652.1 hypothetical protein BEWA_025010 [Theileria equi strain WA]|eukprot:XP_004829318.1 hypothetical protein BEWA_025010 [Theileria equi strain WA]